MAQQSEELFGFSLEGANRIIPSPVVKQTEEGVELPVGGVVGYTYDLYQKARNEWALINQYRDIAFYPEADSAIDDIVNEAFTTEYERPSVSLRLDLLNVDERIKERIRSEFKNAITSIKVSKKVL